MWVKDGLAWVDLQTQLPPTHTHTHTHTPSSVWKGESRGGRVSGRTLLWVTPECLCSDVYFLCVVCTVFVCQAEAVFPSSPASAVLTVKQSLDDGWALCINSLSEPMTTQLKIDHAYITQQNTPTHTHTPSHFVSSSHLHVHTLIIHSLSCTIQTSWHTQSFSSLRPCYTHCENHRSVHLFCCRSWKHFSPATPIFLHGTAKRLIFSNFAVVLPPSWPQWPCVVCVFTTMADGLCVCAWLSRMGSQGFPRIHLFFSFSKKITIE